MRTEIVNHVLTAVNSNTGWAFGLPGHSSIAEDTRPEAGAFRDVADEGYALASVRARACGFNMTRRQARRARRAYNAWRRRLQTAATNMVASW